jgi:hypothetical protein
LGQDVLAAMVTVWELIVIVKWDNLQGKWFEYFCHLGYLPQNIRCKGFWLLGIIFVHLVGYLDHITHSHMIIFWVSSTPYPTSCPSPRILEFYLANETL